MADNPFIASLRAAGLASIEDVQAAASAAEAKADDAVTRVNLLEGLMPSSQPTSPTGPTFLTADVSAPNQTAVPVSGLGITIPALKQVYFNYELIVDAAAATTGIQIALSGGLGLILSSAQVMHEFWTSPTVVGHSAFNTLGSFVPNTASPGTTRTPWKIQGFVQSGITGGVIRPEVKSELTNSAVAVRRGSLVVFAEV